MENTNIYKSIFINYDGDVDGEDMHCFGDKAGNNKVQPYNKVMCRAED